MKRLVVLASVLVVLLAVVATTASATSLFGTRFKVGTEIQFRVEDETTAWWWGCCNCCSCTPSQILGWRIASATGQVVYSVVHDAPVPAASWLGSWKQLDANGAAAAVGQYILYVDTSAGTLSRCFSLYDPCGCNTCWSPCLSCTCQEVATITNCSCQTDLVFVDTCTNGCWPFFSFFGCGCGCTQP